ncbi:MAG: TorF family putative porin [Gammaproteobacteria bacterium]|nr:TorF family putative porin [Gammaproteobacteria bacterium]
MKKTVLTGMTLGVALAAAVPMTAVAGEGTANVALVSDYLWRGDATGDASLQGGYDYDFGNGFSAGVWGSTLTGDFEYDLYGGYAGKAGEMDYSVGYIYYGYQNATAASEYNLGLGFKDVSFMYSADTASTATYMELGYEMDLSGVGVGFHYGTNGITPDYSIGASKDFSGYNVGLTFASKTTTAFALSVSKEF